MLFPHEIVVSIEQSAAVKFCILLILNCSKTAYKDFTVGKTQAHEWSAWIKNVTLWIDNKPRKSINCPTRWTCWKNWNFCAQTANSQLINCQKVVGYLVALFTEFKRIGNEKSCCKVFSRALSGNQKEHRVETFRAFETTGWNYSRFFGRRSLLVISHGAIVTTQK